jgi:hypothetical protein
MKNQFKVKVLPFLSSKSLSKVLISHQILKLLSPPRSPFFLRVRKESNFANPLIARQAQAMEPPAHTNYFFSGVSERRAELRICTCTKSYMYVCSISVALL